MTVWISRSTIPRRAEDLLVLAADTGIENMRIILGPVDFRRTSVQPDGRPLPRWTRKLYDEIARELRKLPVSELGE